MGGNLDRVQIIKGWIDTTGARQEKIYDVAWSDNRTLGADGKLPAVGNTVDVANATWTNTIGSAELITVWKDPDFDPRNVRCTTTRHRDPDPALDRIRCESVPRDRPGPAAPMITQERAYTSPIW